MIEVGKLVYDSEQGEFYLVLPEGTGTPEGIYGQAIDLLHDAKLLPPALDVVEKLLAKEFARHKYWYTLGGEVTGEVTEGEHEVLDRARNPR